MIATLCSALGLITIYVINRQYNKRLGPMSYRAPKKTAFSTRLDRPVIDILDSSGVQQWNPSSSMNIRHLDKSRTKRTFTPEMTM
jgi:hypothetical protein